jgi:hypothetical protein
MNTPCLGSRFRIKNLRSTVAAGCEIFPIRGELYAADHTIATWCRCQRYGEAGRKPNLRTSRDEACVQGSHRVRV